LFAAFDLSFFEDEDEDERKEARVIIKRGVSCPPATPRSFDLVASKLIHLGFSLRRPAIWARFRGGSFPAAKSCSLSLTSSAFLQSVALDVVPVAVREFEQEFKSIWHNVPLSLDARSGKNLHKFHRNPIS